MTASLRDQIRSAEERLAALNTESERVRALLEDLRCQELSSDQGSRGLTGSGVSAESQAAEKIRLFMELFRGRDDLFARRWEKPGTGRSGYTPACHNHWVPGVCDIRRVKCGACPNQAFIPLSEAVIQKHLCGEGTGPQRREYTVGIYPLLKDETCWFLTVDFDEGEWQRDAGAFLDTCRRLRVPASLERSRSGNGGHVWIFFSAPVAASQARKLGSFLITASMEARPEIGFKSYDRLFPNQDTMPAGGFGNLIALPLQWLARQAGNSVFLDERFEPFSDQWAYLSSVRKMTPTEVEALVEEAAARGRIFGVRLPLEDEEEHPWLAPPSRRKPELPLAGTLPTTVPLVLGNQVYIAKEALPPSVMNRLLRLAAFQNPDFWAAQSMRLPTFGKPRIIACAEIFPKHLALPRGCLDAAVALLESLGIKPIITDERCEGTPVRTHFVGELNQEQECAVAALAAHDTGVLAAATGFGKTVVAARLIAERQVSTLVLVHRRQLLEQWAARLAAFLDIPPGEIGRLAAGKRKLNGSIDIALLQSLVRKGEVKDCVAQYGQVIIDECHHLPAVSFEAIARACKARYVLGLSATVTRKDGHHPIIFMRCGPIRFRFDARKQAETRPFSHRVCLHDTAFRLPPASDGADPPSIQAIYAAIAGDEARNRLIVNDVLAALGQGRSPLILTERKSHVLDLASRLAGRCRNIIVLHGGMADKRMSEIQARIAAIPDGEERLLIATGRYVGEGFDDARLDTLFLAMPVAWHGTLAQYAGRIQRLHPSKKEVVIHDYVDRAVPVLARMADKRMKGYQRLGFELADAPRQLSLDQCGIAKQLTGTGGDGTPLLPLTGRKE